ncbi:MAG: GNAT family N-acetyltransferase [Candidatus Bathyarchaeota archaeon]|nr:GNAT family N-acetyltransferase [Candidatus Bathyarchaeota archaeon]
MAEFVKYDPNVHNEEFRQLDTEYLTWQINQVIEKEQINIESQHEEIIQAVNRHFNVLASLEPPVGILYLLGVNEEVAGMGGIRKLSDEVARIMWMYIRPIHRGRGYGKQLLNILLENGRNFGYSTFQLAPPKFGHVALSLYRSAGFKEVEDSEGLLETLQPLYKPYYIVMEKKE